MGKGVKWSWDRGETVAGVTSAIVIATIFGLVSLRDTTRDHTLLLKQNASDHIRLEKTLISVDQKLDDIILRSIK